MKNKAVFLDRDGTINVEKGFVYHVDQFELLSGTLEALCLLTDHQISIYIVTNQSGIAKGFYTEEDFHAVTEYMNSLFEEEGISISGVLYCPHHPEGKLSQYTKVCECRKPGTKLIENVLRERGFEKEDVALVGDKNSDIEAARKLNILSYLVETGCGAEHKKVTQASCVVPDLLAAVKDLIGRWELK